MKTNPLVYILVVGIGIVVLLMILVNDKDDSLLDSQNASLNESSPASYLAEDRDNPSEAVKAVGSQINELREEQSAFETKINQTVDKIHRELQTLHSAIKKLANQRNATVNQMNARQTDSWQTDLREGAK